MTVTRATVFLLCCLLCPAFPANAAETAPGAIAWRTLEPGLELARVPVTFTPSPLFELSVSPFPFVPPTPPIPPVPSVSSAPPSPEGVDPGRPPEPEFAPDPMTANVTILRIDPERFTFSLYMASESGPKTLAEIARTENFVAAINAGMFQRDRSTSTGHLRSRTHTNNPRVAGNFGAFFVAGPLDGKPPHARLLDRNAHDWQAALDRYALVMQNYRMTAADGRVIWKQADRNHSVAALSQDDAGRILFILCPDPVPAADFVAALLQGPLNAGTVMYLEGGSEAALLVNAGDADFVEAGRHVSGLWGGSAALMLPNVLGIRRKAP